MDRSKGLPRVDINAASLSGRSLIALTPVGTIETISLASTAFLFMNN